MTRPTFSTLKHGNFWCVPGGIEPVAGRGGARDAGDGAAPGADVALVQRPAALPGRDRPAAHRSRKDQRQIRSRPGSIFDPHRTHTHKTKTIAGLYRIESSRRWIILRKNKRWRSLFRNSLVGHDRFDPHWNIRRRYKPNFRSNNLFS